MFLLSFLGVTILLSLTVFLNMVAETMPATSDAVPLLGKPLLLVPCPLETCDMEGLHPTVRLTDGPPTLPYATHLHHRTCEGLDSLDPRNDSLGTRGKCSRRGPRGRWMPRGGPGEEPCHGPAVERTQSSTGLRRRQYLPATVAVLCRCVVAFAPFGFRLRSMFSIVASLPPPLEKPP